jgi:transposase-like protein
MNTLTPFKGRHFQAEIILLCVRWYLQSHYNRTFEKKSKHPHSQPVDQLSY